jgi:hypothetical protein
MQGSHHHAAGHWHRTHLTHDVRLDRLPPADNFVPLPIPHVSFGLRRRQLLL